MRRTLSPLSPSCRLSLFAAGALSCVCLSGLARAAGESEYYKSEMAKAAEQYKLDQQRCNALQGHDRDVCMQRASAYLLIAKADIRAYDQNTTAAGVRAEKERIKQLYKVDAAKCDGLSGNAEDICDAQADAVRLRREGNLKALTARLEGAYRVAVEKCDELEDSLRSDCKDQAKRNYKP